MRVSFDFDGVLHKSVEEGSINPIYWDEWDLMDPFIEIHNLIKQYDQQGHELLITTARGEMPHVVEKFCQHHELPFVDFHYTYGLPKRDLLELLKVDVHYDDNIRMLETMKGSTVRFHLVEPFLNKFDLHPRN